MTSMPELVALFNGFGGLASLLVGWAEFHTWHVMGDTTCDAGRRRAGQPVFTIAIAYLAVLIGGVTFTGSMVAYAKLAEKISGKPILFQGPAGGQRPDPRHFCSLAAPSSSRAIPDQRRKHAFFVFAIVMVTGFVLGVTSVIPIGGADMPVVISLLNSYSGWRRAPRASSS